MGENNIYDIVPELNEKSPEKNMKKKKKKLSHRKRKALIISIVSASAAVILVLGIIFGLPLLRGSENKEYSIADMPMMYVTDAPGLNYYNYETKKDTLVVSTLVDKNSAMPYVTWAVTSDGKSFFFADEYGDLYRNNLYTDQGNNFIAENVKSFSVTKNGNLLYLSGEGELIYVYFKPDKIGYSSVTVDKGVSEFKCDTKKEDAAYIKNAGDIRYLYRATLSKKPKTALILEDCGDFIDTEVADLSFLFMKKKGADGKTSLYLVKSLKHAVLATDIADEVFSVGEDGSVIYGVSTGQVIDFNLYFTDNKQSEDEELAEPDYGDVLYGKISSAEFDAAMSVYMDKTSRDTIRNMIAEKNLRSGGYTVYKYKSGKSVAIDENVTEVLDTAEDNSSVVYAVKKYKTSEQKVICDISDFNDVESAEEKINELFRSGKVTYKLYTKSGTVAKEIYTYEEKAVSVHLSDDMTGLYIFEEKDGTLKYIDIALGNVSEIRDVATDVIGLTFKDGNVLYSQKSTVPPEESANADAENPDTAEKPEDTDSETETKETSTLYRVVGIKSYKIGDGVDSSNLYISDSAIYYITTGGRLIMRKGEEETEITENATSLYWRGDDKVYYVSFNETNGYSLYIYNGTESHGIATHLLYVLGM